MLLTTLWLAATPQPSAPGLSTTTESKCLPRTVETASLYFFCLALHSSAMRPLTPGRRRFIVVTLSLNWMSLRDCCCPSSISDSFLTACCSFSFREAISLALFWLSSVYFFASSFFVLSSLYMVSF